MSEIISNSHMTVTLTKAYPQRPHNSIFYNTHIFSHIAIIFHVSTGSQKLPFYNSGDTVMNLLVYIKGHSSHFHYFTIKDNTKMNISGQTSFCL